MIGVQTLLETFLNISLRSVSFTDRDFLNITQNFQSWDYSKVFFFFREGVTKCSDEVYNKVTGIREHNNHLLGVYRLRVSTC